MNDSLPAPTATARHARSILFAAVAATLAATLALPTPARADAERARAYLGAARDDIKGGNYDSVQRTLELFEDELEGVDAATTAALRAEAETIKKEAAEKKFTASFDDAEKALTRLEKDRDLARQIKDAREKPDDADAQAFLNGAIQNCKNFEEEHLKKLPEGHPRTGQINERYEKFAGPILKLSLAAEKAQFIESARKNWAFQQERAGQETDAPPMTYRQWADDAAGGPIRARRSLAMASSAREMLEDERTKGFATAFADDAEVGGLIKEIRAAYDAGVARVGSDVTTLVAEFEKGPPDAAHQVEVLRAAEALVEVAPTEPNKELVARVEKTIAQWEKAENAQTAAMAAKIEALERSADEMWPAIVAKYEGQTVDLDPAAALADIDSVKGKLVRFADNANVGATEFNAPDFAYVGTVDGKPIAFKFNDRCNRAVAAYEGFAKRPMGANDFRDVVGRVVGTGKLNHRAYDNIREAWVTIGQVDVPVCEIVAFKSVFITVGEDGANTEALK